MSGEKLIYFNIKACKKIEVVYKLAKLNKRNRMINTFLETL